MSPRLLQYTFWLLYIFVLSCNPVHTKWSENCARCIEAAEKCDLPEFQKLYENIERDLLPWKTTGISLALMDDTLAHETILYSKGKKGIGFLISNGTVYTTHNLSRLPDTQHHHILLLTYMQVLYGLQLEYGPMLPNVEFIIQTGDGPSIPLQTSSAIRPVFRFCKDAEHADILCPNFHFYLKHYDRELLSAIPLVNQEYPWSQKSDKLFGRFSDYFRIGKSNSTLKAGYNGTNICQKGTCQVRSHFMSLQSTLSQGGVEVDVSGGRRIPMTEHSKFKYLLHLDGFACSSRLEQLLPLGSLVFKEESGYWAYYHHVLEPYKHYIPFWKQYPEDIIDGLAWAETHDAMAKQISQAAQNVARVLLRRKARSCYWYRLLHRYSELLHFDPGLSAQLRHQMLAPVTEYLQGPGAQLVNQYNLTFEDFYDSQM